MHVSWFWIKQRPQFLVEELSKKHKLTVVCLEDTYDAQKIQNASTGLPFVLTTIFLFSKKLQGLFVSKVNFYLKKIQLRFLIRKTEVVWLNTPTQFLHIKTLLQPGHVLVYDCKDDMAAFHESDPAVFQNIIAIEMSLCLKADLILASSDVLKSRIKERYAVDANVFVVNNGLSDQLFEHQQPAVLPGSLDFMLTDTTRVYVIYIGTISSWFDFDRVILAASQNTRCTFVLIGPADIPIPVHPSIIHVPPVQHSFVNSIMQFAHVLIMPFRITELVKAVNPVKAYEYISSGKPVILSSYSETAKFKDYAYLYTDDLSFSALINSAANHSLLPKKSPDECLTFAKENTWTKRGLYIQQLLQAHNGE